jgi:hypothetical protein
LRDIAKKLADENQFPFATVYDAMLSSMTAAKGVEQAAAALKARDALHVKQAEQAEAVRALVIPIRHQLQLVPLAEK